MGTYKNRMEKNLDYESAIELGHKRMILETGERLMEFICEYAESLCMAKDL